jgi:hypothetical protein
MVKGRVPPVVAKAGRRAFEVTFQKGERGGNSSNSNFDIAPPGFFPADEVRVSFFLYFDDRFPWSPTPAMPKIGGKLGGFEIGQGSASGGNFSTTGASFRITFANEGGLLGYVYPQVRRAFRDDDKGSSISWDLLDQSAAFQRISKITKGVHVFVPEGGKQGDFDLELKKGRWNEIEMYAKLNTPGKYDGVLELTVNGVKKRTEHARLRHTGIRLQAFKLHPFFGGSQRPPFDTKAWYADFSFSRT